MAKFIAVSTFELRAKVERMCINFAFLAISFGALMHMLEQPRYRGSLERYLAMRACDNFCFLLRAIMIFQIRDSLGAVETSDSKL